MLTRLCRHVQTVNMGDENIAFFDKRIDVGGIVEPSTVEISTIEVVFEHSEIDIFGGVPVGYGL